MSDFRLPQIAFLARKDARTIRRWCEAGLVRGAFRLGGARGHWRIRASSAVEAAEQALAATRGFSRARGKRWESTLRRFAQSAAKIQRKARPLRGQVVKLERTARRTARTLRPAARALQLLLEVSDDRLERVGWSRVFLEKLRGQIMPRRTARELIRSALILSMLEEYEDTRTEPERARAAIARRFGLDRRTFNRDFGAHWRGAVEAFSDFCGVGAAGDSAFDYKGSKADGSDTAPERVPVEMPPHATAKELRIYRAG